MQLPMGTQARDQQRQARMDMGTRSMMLDRGAYNTLYIPGWKQRHRCLGCAIEPQPLQRCPGVYGGSSGFGEVGELWCITALES